MRIFISNIKSLLQTEDNENSRLLARGQDMKMLPSIDNAWLLIEDGLIKAYGDMSSLDTSLNVDQTIDAKGGLVLPAWCDSHTHLVFAHSREHEFIDRINGLSYEAIAQRGGGILNSAKKLNAASEDELVDLAMQRLDEVKALGTGAIEIKSGYGL
jgi:imidazolonepropionase